MTFQKKSDTLDFKPAARVITYAKGFVTDAAAKAFIIGILPMSFAYNQPGKPKLAMSLISFDQRLSLATPFDIIKLLPSPLTVLNPIMRTAKGS